MQRDGTTHGSVSAGLAAANAAIPTVLGARFPGEDAGHSLAEMAQRDLDAALQLLADRAQYITGANGAAIALRRTGKQDLLCRASIGPNAPELGALLSTEFGLSGESVRTRKALRCDDAERDARVNREVCRQLGIASVVVMPVVHDDEVLGVFELFSGQAHAFGERDLSALERLSEMVETAVRLARAAEQVPEPPVPEQLSARTPAVGQQKPASVPQLPFIPPPAFKSVTAQPDSAKPAPKKLLLWSAPVQTETQSPAQPETSLVPPVFRGLRKCEACGFPISAGRALCVECEEKRWRGQLKRPQTFQPSASPLAPGSSASAAAAPARALTASSSVSAPAPVRQLPVPRATSVAVADPPESKHLTTAPKPEPDDLVQAPVAMTGIYETSAAFTLSAGLPPQQSWLSANKYILGAILAVAATVAAILLLR